MFWKVHWDIQNPFLEKCEKCGVILHAETEDLVKKRLIEHESLCQSDEWSDYIKEIKEGKKTSKLFEGMDEKEESVENQTKKENGETRAYNQLNEKQLETLDSNKIEVQAKITTNDQTIEDIEKDYFQCAICPEVVLGVTALKLHTDSKHFFSL